MAFEGVLSALQGWRVIFFTTAGVAAGATLAVLFGGIEPRSLRPKEKVRVQSSNIHSSPKCSTIQKRLNSRLHQPCR